MVGQVPQALMQTGQGLAQAATQGLSGMASQKPADAELAKSARVARRPTSCPRRTRRRGRRWRWRWRHPSGRCARSARHSVDVAHGADHARGSRGATGDPTPAGGSAMGGMPMGMPMGGMMPHGATGRRRRWRQGARGQEGRGATAAAHRAGDRKGVRPDRGRRRGCSRSSRVRRPRRRIRRGDPCYGESRWRRCDDEGP